MFNGTLVYRKETLMNLVFLIGACGFSSCLRNDVYTLLLKKKRVLSIMLSKFIPFSALKNFDLALVQHHYGRTIV